MLIKLVNNSRSRVGADIGSVELPIARPTPSVVDAEFLIFFPKTRLLKLFTDTQRIFQWKPQNNLTILHIIKLSVKDY